MSDAIRLTGNSTKISFSPGSDTQLNSILIGTPSLGMSLAIYDNVGTGGVSTATSRLLINIDGGQLAGQRDIPLYGLRLDNGGAIYLVNGGGNGEVTVLLK